LPAIDNGRHELVECGVRSGHGSITPGWARKRKMLMVNGLPLAA
jgi:hypothetical protein